IPPPMTKRSTVSFLFISGSLCSVRRFERQLRVYLFRVGTKHGAVPGQFVPDGNKRPARRDISWEQFLVYLRQPWIRSFRRAEQRCYPFLDAGVHIAVDADCNCRHHGAAGRTGLFPCRNTNRCADASRQNRSKRGGTRGPARQAQFDGHGSHRRIAVAGGHAETLDHTAQKVGKAMTRGKADETRSRVRVDERPALPRLRYVGMVEEDAWA